MRKKCNLTFVTFLPIRFTFANMGGKKLLPLETACKVFGIRPIIYTHWETRALSDTFYYDSFADRELCYILYADNFIESAMRINIAAIPIAEFSFECVTARCSAAGYDNYRRCGRDNGWYPAITSSSLISTLRTRNELHIARPKLPRRYRARV